MTSKQEFLTDAVNKIFNEIIYKMGNWTRAELDGAMDYLTSAPYKDRIRNDIAESLADLFGHMSGSDEEPTDE